MTMNSCDDSVQRITARPGTAEFDAQFEQQALSAADGIFRHWFIRIPCAVFALGNVTAIIDSIFFSEQPTLRFILSLFGGVVIGLICIIHYSEKKVSIFSIIVR